MIFEFTGYELKSKAPFAIGDNGSVTLEVIKTAPGPPENPSSRRDPAAVFEDLPTREEVQTAGKHEAAQCGLWYRNVTNQKLRLLVVDCSRHYRILDAKNSGEQPWMDWPFDPSKEFTYYQKFSDSTGWYCFAVKDEAEKVHPLQPGSRKNICENKITKMTVSSPQDGVFQVAWEVGKEGETPTGND